jgi:hypothetical protein
MMSLKQPGTLLLLVLLSLPSAVIAAAPFDLDLKELDRQEPAAHKSEKKVQKLKRTRTSAAKGGNESSADNAEPTRYTVKPGDHIFKILEVHFGMSNEAAERLIPEIARLNNLSNVKQLTIGQTLLIPQRPRNQERREHAARSGEKAKVHKSEAPETAAVPDKAATLAKGAAISKEPAVAVLQPAPAPLEKSSLAQAAAAPAQPVPATVKPLPAVQPAPPVAVAPKSLPAPTMPLSDTWICSVTEKDPAQMVDSFLNALSLHWSKNRIVQSAGPTSFSIRVDRYFEYKNARYIVSIGEHDPYNYTMIRLLEAAGYRVLMINGKEDFQTLGKRMLAFVGVAPTFGKHVLQGGVTATGFLIRQDDAGGRQVIISGEPADPHQKWVMPQGCGPR